MIIVTIIIVIVVVIVVTGRRAEGPRRGGGVRLVDGGAPDVGWKSRFYKFILLHHACITLYS